MQRRRRTQLADNGDPIECSAREQQEKERERSVLPEDCVRAGMGRRESPASKLKA